MSQKARFTAEEAGYVARNLNVADDTPMAADWRNKGEGVAVPDVQVREMEANRAAKDARRKIMEIMEEDSQPARPVRRPTGGPVQKSRSSGLSMSDLMEGLDDGTLNELRANDSEFAQFSDNTSGGAGAYDDLYEDDEPVAPTRKKVNEWFSQPMQARLTSGKVITVWKVTHKTTGMELPTPFKIEEVADRIAGIINTTGNVNDPRIAKLVESYKKHGQLVKQIRQCKKMISEGQTNKKQTLRKLQAELETVSYRLGI